MQKWRLGYLSAAMIVALSFVSVEAFSFGASLAGKHNVVLVRDSFGVPHLFGSSRDAALYGVGYAQAEDRLWQMELQRRFGKGTAAELLGADYVQQDIVARAFLGNGQMASQFRSSKRRTRDAVRAYVDGVNAYIAEAVDAGDLPVEFGAFGIVPEPWQVADVYAVLGFVGLGFGVLGFEEDINHLSMLTYLTEYLSLAGESDPQLEAWKIFNDIYWLKDPDAFSTIPGSAGITASRSTERSSGLEEAAPALTLLRHSLAQLRSRLQKVTVSRGPASYAVAVGRAMSADDAPLLLGAPQVGYFAPSLLMEFGLAGGAFNATGVTVPGTPFPIAGTTREHAWTITSGVSKMSYSFFEVLDDPGNPTRYLFQDKWRRLHCRIETFEVAGADPVVQPLCETHHGPILQVFSAEEALALGGFNALSVQSPLPKQLHETMDTLTQLAQAKSFASFETAISTLSFNFNVVYADSDDIAYWHAGSVPVPPDPAQGIDPRLPLPGVGIAELQGYLPFEQLPSVINPAEGYLTNWNDKPSSDWSLSIAGSKGPVSRGAALAEMAQEKLASGHATIETLKELERQAAVLNAVPVPNRFNVAAWFSDAILDAVDTSTDETVAQAVELLRSWDRSNVDHDQDGFYDSPAVTVFAKWWNELYQQILADDLGPNYADFLNDFEDQAIAANIVFRLYQDEPGLPLQRDYLGELTRSSAATETLKAALASLGGAWSSTLTPVAEQVWTPQGVPVDLRTPYGNRGSYIQLSDMDPWFPPDIQNILPPGQSGNPFDQHFADQLGLYAQFEFKEMNHLPVQIFRDSKSVKLLNYESQ